MDIINYLLDNGADLHVGKDSDIGSPLHWAVGEHRLDLTRMLIERGCDVNEMNGKKVTPLILATAGTDSGMIRLLLDHKADPTVRFYFIIHSIIHSINHSINQSIIQSFNLEKSIIHLPIDRS